MTRWNIEHSFVQNRNVQIHVVACGDGAPVIFCHGFPELWYSWRRQMPALASAGFRALAPDMRGYGESSTPPAAEDYASQEICSDLLALMDAHGYQQAIFVGHDFGGMIVWHMALMHASRVRAVAALNTPLSPHTRLNPLEMLRKRPGRLAYQLYFQEIGPPEAMLEADIRATLHSIFQSSRSGRPIDAFFQAAIGAKKQDATPLDQQLIRSDLLDDEEIGIYEAAFRKTGFRGALHWYRNMERNWRWLAASAGTVLQMPALMICAADDPVLPPSMTRGMERHVARLTRYEIANCGHWTQQEQPQVVNEILLQWLNTLSPESD
ncbi:MAG: alpha/beta hydrolase [Leptospirales bacterium]|nr:alpha/beta hydrolase [Leptospirales bacterium]